MLTNIELKRLYRELELLRIADHKNVKSSRYALFIFGEGRSGSNIGGQGVLIHPLNLALGGRSNPPPVSIVLIINKSYKFKITRLIDTYSPPNSERNEIYMVIEYMDCPLRALINEHDKYFKNSGGKSLIKNFLYQLVYGVAYLHKNSIVHGVTFIYIGGQMGSHFGENLTSY